MKKKQLSILLSLCLIMVSQTILAQEIWPGDVNNNGIVNGVDLLYLGVAYDAAGPLRLDVSTDWSPQPFPTPWPQNFPNGLNYAYADCDGNGFVDEDDFDKAIEDNFGLTHGTVLSDGYVNGQPGMAPRLRLQSETNVATAGDTVRIDLSLDDSDLPLEDFYAIAISFSYTTDLLEGDDGLDFDLTEDSWIEADNSTIHDIFVDNGGQGKAELAITRTNHETIAADPGVIGQISIVIEDIIVGISVDTIHLQIDSVLLINSDLIAIPVVPDSIDIVVAVKTKWPPIRFHAIKEGFSVYPNPTQEILYVQSDSSLPNLDLVDDLGRSLPIKIYIEEDMLYRIEFPQLPPGLYYLTGRSSEDIFHRKIIISN